LLIRPIEKRANVGATAKRGARQPNNPGHLYRGLAAKGRSATNPIVDLPSEEPTPRLRVQHPVLRMATRIWSRCQGSGSRRAVTGLNEPIIDVSPLFAALSV
jgi:hypothetical protein